MVKSLCRAGAWAPVCVCVCACVYAVMECAGMGALPIAFFYEGVDRYDTSVCRCVFKMGRGEGRGPAAGVAEPARPCCAGSWVLSGPWRSGMRQGPLEGTQARSWGHPRRAWRVDTLHEDGQLHWPWHAPVSRSATRSAPAPQHRR